MASASMVFQLAPESLAALRGVRSSIERLQSLVGDSDSGAGMIAAERLRQVAAEGYNAEHDRGHEEDLVKAAQCYIGLVLRRFHGSVADEQVPFLWPWEDEDWKPTNAVRDLVKAGGLIAAAIDALRVAQRS